MMVPALLLACIAVIDTGVDLSSKVVHAESFASEGVNDVHGHGTLVATVALAEAPAGTEIVSLRVMDDDGRIFSAYFDAALEWVLFHHNEYDIRAVSMSFSGYPTLEPYACRTRDLIRVLRELGIPCCCSVGNLGLEGLGAPAIFPETVSVGAFDPGHWWLEDYSNRLAYSVDVYADGEWFDEEGRRWTGTSISNARIAGFSLCLIETIERKHRRVASVEDLEECFRWKRGQAFPMFYAKYALKRAKVLGRRRR